MEFYNVKTRQKVEVPESGLSKSTLVRKNGRRTYVVTGEDNGTKLSGLLVNNSTMPCKCRD